MAERTFTFNEKYFYINNSASSSAASNPNRIINAGEVKQLNRLSENYTLNIVGYNDGFIIFEFSISSIMDYYAVYYQQLHIEPITNSHALEAAKYIYNQVKMDKEPQLNVRSDIALSYKGSIKSAHTEHAALLNTIHAINDNLESEKKGNEEEIETLMELIERYETQREELTRTLNIIDTHEDLEMKTLIKAKTIYGEVIDLVVTTLLSKFGCLFLMTGVIYGNLIPLIFWWIELDMIEYIENIEGNTGDKGPKRKNRKRFFEILCSGIFPNTKTFLELLCQHMNGNPNSMFFPCITGGSVFYICASALSHILNSNGDFNKLNETIKSIIRTQEVLILIITEIMQSPELIALIETLSKNGDSDIDIKICISKCPDADKLMYLKIAKKLFKHHGMNNHYQRLFGPANQAVQAANPVVKLGEAAQAHIEALAQIQAAQAQVFQAQMQAQMQVALAQMQAVLTQAQIQAAQAHAHMLDVLNQVFQTQVFNNDTVRAQAYDQARAHALAHIRPAQADADEFYGNFSGKQFGETAGFQMSRYQWGERSEADENLEKIENCKDACLQFGYTNVFAQMVNAADFKKLELALAADSGNIALQKCTECYRRAIKKKEKIQELTKLISKNVGSYYAMITDPAAEGFISRFNTLKEITDAIWPHLATTYPYNIENYKNLLIAHSSIETLNGIQTPKAPLIEGKSLVYMLPEIMIHLVNIPTIKGIILLSQAANDVLRGMRVDNVLGKVTANPSIGTKISSIHLSEHFRQLLHILAREVGSTTRVSFSTIAKDNLIQDKDGADKYAHDADQATSTDIEPVYHVDTNKFSLVQKTPSSRNGGSWRKPQYKMKKNSKMKRKTKRANPRKTKQRKQPKQKISKKRSRK